jgi:pimeloyl-ACP methyl ester carboxylesterase
VGGLDRPVKTENHRSVPRAATNGIELEYERFGDPGDPTLLLVSGLGAQMNAFPTDLCQAFVDRGFSVIRFDNRDVGLSTKIDVGDLDVIAAMTAAMSGQAVEPPYLLSDMADDAWGLLDALGIGQAHLLGMSMGGMIVQTMAVQHPERVSSITSLMSSTGDADVGHPRPEVIPSMLERAPAEREAFVAHSVEGTRLIGSPEHFDEGRARARHREAFDRCYYPAGSTHQLIAILASGSRGDALRRLDLPALVIHGSEDPLVDVSGGERTAECLQGCELLILDGMGHDLPPSFWARIVEAVTALASRAATSA